MFGAPSWGDSAGQDYDYSVVETGAIDDQGAGDDSKAGKKRKAKTAEALEAIAALLQDGEPRNKGPSSSAGKKSQPPKAAADDSDIKSGKTKNKKKQAKQAAAAAAEEQGNAEADVAPPKAKKSKNKVKADLAGDDDVATPAAGGAKKASAAHDDPAPAADAAVTPKKKNKKKSKNKFKPEAETNGDEASEALVRDVVTTESNGAALKEKKNNKRQQKAAAEAADATEGSGDDGEEEEEAGAPAAAAGGRSILGNAGKAGGKGKGGLLEQMRAKLQGGQFRWLNETMYTQPGDESYKMMQEEPELFQKYHEGFRQQTHGWPKLPVDIAIKWLKGRKASEVVADFGCGDAKIAKEVKQKVHSLDLVTTQPGVIACDMAQTPLEDASVDIAVFCLALMGTDYAAFLREAFRVLKPGGRLWVAEVRSRFASEGGATEVQGLQKFVAALKQLGFALCNKDASNRMFVILELNKREDGNAAPEQQARSISWPPLKACTYKRR